MNGAAQHSLGASTIPIAAATERLAYSPCEAAELLGVSRNFIYGLMREGALPSVKMKRARRIRREALIAFLDRLEPGAAA